ncbi:hypothetical protein CA233_23180 [Sphingomonas sp. ABOLD]|uniref:Uncharacterized protein n=1 Tax=Sphingomonas trueperi TaxID=53317 RepID=A0A7X6BDG5_9SPHN|nr:MULTISPECIES: hypothetical protein [Sphingomonas]NJB97876.1 hypothetical protein [Sphingomonas trueperi]RSV35350.1 hypothetical protein CA233_23180 [Sphingomonas sp. ABOLD]RSV41474.1 hypothetical protein CA234_09340 [Sphingomonas sp. ABOLE]
MRGRSGARNDRGNPVGGAIAQVASIGTLALGHFLWFTLRIAYRSDPKLAAAAACGCVCVVTGVTVWAVVT